MNEELRIIIRAVTADAQRNLAEVRGELERIETTGGETGKSVSGSMAAMGKAALAVVGIVTALTAAMITLGKRSMEFRQEYSKLIGAFQAGNGTVEQATATYKELFGFLGVSDQAVEASQNLIKLTNNSEELAEWTTILRGVYTTFGKSLPVESLAEAANETVKVGKVTGAMADALNWAGVSEDAFNEALANTNSIGEREILVRSTLNQLYSSAAMIYERNNKAIIDYNKSQADLDIALQEATIYVVPLLTKLNELATMLLQVCKPAFETIAAVVIVFVQWLMAAIEAIGTFFGIFDSTSAPTGDIVDSFEAIEDSTSGATESVQGLGGALNGAADAAAELKKQVMGFDELNVVNSQTAVGGITSGGVGGIGGAGGIAIPSIADINTTMSALKDFQSKVEDIAERMEGLAVLAGLVATALVGWKIADFLSDMGVAIELIKRANTEGAAFYETIAGKKAQEQLDGIKRKAKDIGANLLAAAGSASLAYGYSDAWAEGIDWGNFAAIQGGIVAIITALALAFGWVGAVIGAVIGGIANLVLAVKDMIEEGATAQNMVLLLIGTLTTGLLPGMIAVTIALFNQKPAIMEVADAQAKLNKAKEDAAEAEFNYVYALDSAEQSLARLEELEKQHGVTGAELYAQVQAGTLNYKDMTAAQKEVYKAYLDNEKQQKALKESTEKYNKAKKAETLASYEHQLALAKESGSYDDFKKSVVKAFEAGELSAEEARDLISKSMSEMSDEAQQAFMEDIPDSIKDGLDPHKYESMLTQLKKGFSNTCDSIGRFFSNLWDNIVKGWNNFTTKFKAIAVKIGDTISSAVKSAISNVLSKSVGIINGFIKAINVAIDVINGIPGVDISKLDLLDVPKLATGGVVNSATIAMIGERGKEAVLPLENNTGWMDALADRIAARNGTPTRVVLKVGETELGYATIGAINNITQQTGELPLVVV